MRDTLLSIVIVLLSACGDAGDVEEVTASTRTGAAIAPTVSITAKPANPTNQRTASFRFTASGGALACKLDGGAAAACSSPRSYSGLAAGSHTFRVTATDAAGNVGSASYTWSVDLSPPAVTITGHPPNPTSQTMATFTFTTSQGSPKCSFDGGAGVACSSPRTYAGLAGGLHSFTVTATDAAGNVGSANYTWTVDVTPPIVTLTQASHDASVGGALFTFTVSDGSVICYVDGAPLGSCSSPLGVVKGPGGHTLSVRATDAAGNVGSASSSFVGDTYVDAIHGNDAASGLAGFPLKTIKHALSFAVPTATIHCAPGTYDAANGETFPIIVPPGVTLAGDSANRGAPHNATHTQIIGSGGVFGPQQLTLYPGAGSSIVGFEIVATGTLPNAAIYAGTANVDLQFNMIVNGVGDGVYVSSQATGLYVADNYIGSNAGNGIYADHIVFGAERNSIVGNDTYGIAMVGALVDVGGGSEGMSGGNRIQCNAVADVYSDVGGGAIVRAEHNFWDHGGVQSSTVCGDYVNFCSPGDTIDGADAHTPIDSCGP